MRSRASGLGGALAVGGAITLGACSLFTDFGGLSNGTTSPEGGSASDTGAPDVVQPEKDATTTDAPITSDAGVDACAGYRFCDSFDDRTEVKGGWDRLTIRSASADLTTSALSAPRALLFAMPAKANGVDTDATVLEKELPIPADRTIRIELDVNLDVIRAGYGDESYSVVFQFGYDDRYAGGMSIVKNGLSVGIWNYPAGVAPGQQDIFFAPNTETGKWIHLLLEEKLDPTLGHAHMEINGQVFFDVDRKTTLVAPTTYSFGILAGSRGTTPQLRATFDNVRAK
jgi:hypothetical protein